MLFKIWKARRVLAVQTSNWCPHLVLCVIVLGRVLTHPTYIQAYNRFLVILKVGYM